jgi:hypothetical protein
MGKKKTADKEPEATEEGFRFSDILHSDAKRSIAAVLLFAFSLILILGYMDAAGKLGEWLDDGMGMLFGFGKWPFPLILMVAGIMFLTRRKTTLADAVKYIGLLIAFISLLGFTHLLSGNSDADLLSLAKAGHGGGFIGYGFASLLLGLTSRLAGGVILLMLFLIGVIAAFNVSLIHWFELIHTRFTLSKKETEAGDTPDTLEEQVFASDMTKAEGDTLDPDQSEGNREQGLEMENASPELVSFSEESLMDGNIESLRFHEDEKIRSR